jgi:hypothetical protein
MCASADGFGRTNYSGNTTTTSIQSSISCHGFPDLITVGDQMKVRVKFAAKGFTEEGQVFEAVHSLFMGANTYRLLKEDGSTLMHIGISAADIVEE